MVGLSDLPFRLLVRRHGADCAYTQMIDAGVYVSDAATREALHATCTEEPGPLIVQLSGTDPAAFVAAGLIAQARGAAAVDVNLGCPTDAARAGCYGAYTPHDLAVRIVHALSSSLRIPVTAKVRLAHVGGVEATVRAALALEAAGASAVIVHGRTRGSPDKRRVGAADLYAIARVVAALSIPVITNGNVRCHGDLHANLRVTGAAGIMIAEAALRNPGVGACARRPPPRGGIDLDGDLDGSGVEAEDSACACGPSGADATPPFPAAVAFIREYLHLAQLHPPPTIAVAAAHVAWLLGRSGAAGNVRYAHRCGLPHADITQALRHTVFEGMSALVEVVEGIIGGRGNE